MALEFSMVGGDIEEAVPINPQKKSTGTVLPFVGVACLGAILFGYHLAYVEMMTLCYS